MMKTVRKYSGDRVYQLFTAIVTKMEVMPHQKRAKNVTPSNLPNRVLEGLSRCGPPSSGVLLKPVPASGEVPANAPPPSVPRIRLLSWYRIPPPPITRNTSGMRPNHIVGSQ